jgi:hypothetical protein
LRKTAVGSAPLRGQDRPLSLPDRRPRSSP